MEGLRVSACNSSLQASLSSRRTAAGMCSIARRSHLIAFGLRREGRTFQGVHGWNERSRLVFGSRKEQRRGLEVVRSRSGADGCCGENAERVGSGREREGLSEDFANRSTLGNAPEAGRSPRAKHGVQLNHFFVVNWSRLQVTGWLALVAFGIGASAASASVSGINSSRRYAPPCFASVSSASDKGRDSRGVGTTTVTPEDSTEGHEQDQSKDDLQEQPVDTKGAQDNDSVVDVKEVEIVGQENEGDEGLDEDDLAADEYEDAESDVDVGSDDEGTNYPTIGDLEDLDELGELASGAAAAELLSGSGEIESAEAEGERGLGGDTEDEDLKKAFDEWRSKPYPLTVPLRLVGLRGSVPPAWLKEFLMSQGKNAKVSAEFKGSLSDILADLATSMENNQITPRSIMAADLVTVGDSWLAAAVQGGLIEPIRNAEEFDWFNRLHPRWQNFLRRDVEGVIDPNGSVWGIPYRWGSLVFAFRKDKLEKNGIAPIRDWKDLFQPQLAGRVAMVDNPREVVGAVLKSLGASYNSDFDTEVPGGREAVKERFVALQKQVRLFDDNDYLKAMGAGDVWVAVGWSSDIVSYSKRASNISVFAPESGTSLWADLWAIPATTTFKNSENVGGRVRGPSPLVFQWFDFCLQPARAMTFANDVFVGASPLAWSEKTGTAETLEDSVPGTGTTQVGKEAKSVINMDTNIVRGMPPNEVVAKSEFLEPLSDKGISDYQWLLSAPVDVVGWPSSVAEFLKGIAASLHFRNPQGSRS